MCLLVLYCHSARRQGDKIFNSQYRTDDSWPVTTAQEIPKKIKKWLPVETGKWGELEEWRNETDFSAFAIYTGLVSEPWDSIAWSKNNNVQNTIHKTVASIPARLTLGRGEGLQS